MQYISTRGAAQNTGSNGLGFAEVTLAGLAPDGGLFVPREWPRFSVEDIRSMRGLSYVDLAARVEAGHIWLPATALLEKLIISKLGTAEKLAPMLTLAGKLAHIFFRRLL